MGFYNHAFCGKLAQLVYIPFFLGSMVFGEDVEIAEFSEIDNTFSALNVSFDLEETENHLLAAYYDSDRKMCVALRKKDESDWQITKLPSTVGWDSHNYLELAVDKDGFIHLSGNMHNVSLIYFRSQKPLDISAFDAPGMVGNKENSVTYPIFIKMPDSSLIFQYRDGGSGGGNTIWNKYNSDTKTWTRLTESGFFDGQGQVNAYHSAPKLGPDGYFHLTWMWRETPEANTNFNLSYIKSADLLSWESAQGQPVSIPINPSLSGVVADPVPSGNGLINMSFGVGWDTEERPILYYHKYDASGISQIYNTRFENGSWKINQTSQWSSFKWDLDRIGSLIRDVGAEQPYLDEEGNLLQSYFHRQFGMGTWKLDPEDLSGEDWDAAGSAVIDSLLEPQSSFPNMEVHWRKQGHYYLRWETLPINQDRAYSEPYPDPSPIVLYRLKPKELSAHFKTPLPSSWSVSRETGGFVLRAPGHLSRLKAEVYDIRSKLLWGAVLPNPGRISLQSLGASNRLLIFKLKDVKSNSSMTVKRPFF